ncbi:MAG TPA: hypothetical protein VGK58_01250, partial [Lacipirellulaceae bacterium]
IVLSIECQSIKSLAHRAEAIAIQRHRMPIGQDRADRMPCAPGNDVLASYDRLAFYGVAFSISLKRKQA